MPITKKKSKNYNCYGPEQVRNDNFPGLIGPDASYNRDKNNKHGKKGQPD